MNTRQKSQFTKEEWMLGIYSWTLVLWGNRNQKVGPVVSLFSEKQKLHSERLHLTVFQVFLLLLGTRLGKKKKSS